MSAILVVDDNPTNRKVLSALLGFEGYLVVEAVDGADALAKAHSATFDLVISDILMPSMDGYEFVRRLRLSAEHQRTPVIFYTAHYLEAEARLLAARCGVSTVIAKPCDGASLIDAVTEALRTPPSPLREPLEPDEAFDPEHLRILSNKLATTADELRSAKARAEALVELNLELAAERDPATLLDNVCNGARALLGAKFAVLAVADPISSAVQHIAVSGVDFAGSAPPHLQMATGPLSSVFRGRRSLRLEGSKAAVFPPAYPAFEHLLAVPVASLMHGYGWLCVADRLDGAPFTSDDQRILQILGLQVGRVYESGSLYAKTQTYAAQLIVQMEERDLATASLRSSEERFRQIAENIQDVLFIVSVDTFEVSYVSPAYERIWGRPAAAVLGDPSAWSAAIHDDDRQRVLTESARITANLPEPGAMEFRIVRPDGSVRWILSRLFPIMNQGAVRRAVGVSRDVTESHLAAEKIDHLNRVLSMLSGINALIVREHDREKLLWAACRLAVEHGRFKIAWCGLLDAAADAVEAVAWAGEAPEASKTARLALTDSASMVATAIRSKAPFIVNDLRDPSARAFNRATLVEQGYRAAVALPLIVAGDAIGCVTLITNEIGFFNEAEMRLLTEYSGDIAFALDHIGKSERLNYLAYYDSLTGLANRTLFQERLAQQIGTAQRAGTQLGLLIANAERFDVYNEAFGRAAGDQLLCDLAARFTECVGGAELAGRIGSNHFAAIILARSPTDVARAVDDIRSRWLGKPFTIAGQASSVAAKIGVAVFPTDGPDSETMLRSAETALKNAKETGKAQAFYTVNLSEHVAERLAIEKRLQRALDNEEFVVYYQPKVDLEHRRVCGVEALIRWQSPDLGLVSPGRFIPLLEESGMIVDVGAWVLRQATFDRSQWLERGLNAPRVAVNVSTIQLQRDDFVRTVSRVLRLAGSEAGIDIEVTESLLMTDVEGNLAKLTALKALGVGIALDDFGTGYSSLGYLAKLPVQTLKIDRSFISAMLNDPGAMTLVSTILSLASTLRLETVAEGVESEEQAKILRLLRCDQIQGYLISPPLPFEDLTQFLGRHRNPASATA